MSKIVPYWTVFVSKKTIKPDSDGEGGVKGFKPIPLCELRTQHPHLLADLVEAGVRLGPITCAQPNAKKVNQLRAVAAEKGYLLTTKAGPCKHDVMSLEPEKDDPEHVRSS